MKLKVNGKEIKNRLVKAVLLMWLVIVFMILGGVVGLVFLILIPLVIVFAVPLMLFTFGLTLLALIATNAARKKNK